MAWCFFYHKANLMFGVTELSLEVVAIPSAYNQRVNQSVQGSFPITN